MKGKRTVIVFNSRFQDQNKFYSFISIILLSFPEKSGIIKYFSKLLLILCILFLTNCQQIKKEPSIPDFRVSLSVSPFTELMFEEGFYYVDGKRTACTVEELQKFFIAYGSTEVYERFATKHTVTDFFLMPQQEMISWLQQHIWPYIGKLFKAVSDGIRSVDPDARFSTHLSGMSATNPEMSVAFFKAMNNEGYNPDELGLSYYPTNNNQRDLLDFKETVTQLNKELRKKVFIAEFGYPAGIMTGQFEWNAELDGYPLTEEGQASFTRDIVSWGYSSKMLSGIRPWAPDFLNPGWLPMSYFNLQGKKATAQVGLDAFQIALKHSRNSTSK